jgi:hypothetical protein
MIANAYAIGMMAHVYAGGAMPDTQPDLDPPKIPRALRAGQVTHSVLCMLLDEPAVLLTLIAAELGVPLQQVHTAMTQLRYHGCLVGTHADREITDRGRAIIRATVRGARV